MLLTNGKLKQKTKKRFNFDFGGEGLSYHDQNSSAYKKDEKGNVVDYSNDAAEVDVFSLAKKMQWTELPEWTGKSKECPWSTVENGKVVIKNRWDLYYGGGSVIFVFDRQGWDLYSFSTQPNAKPHHHRADLELSRDYFVEYYPDSMLVFSPDRISQLKEGDNLRIYLMAPETEEFFNEKVLSN